MRCPRFCARLRPSAVRVRIRSRSTSAKPPKTASSSARCWCRYRPTARRANELRLGVHDLLDDSEQVEGAGREAVNPRYRHHVAGGEGLQHFEKFAPAAVRAGHLLAVNLGGTARAAKLLKLGVERLPVSADAGIAETAVLRVRSDHILRQ